MIWARLTMIVWSSSYKERQKTKFDGGDGGGVHKWRPKKKTKKWIKKRNEIKKKKKKQKIGKGKENGNTYNIMNDEMNVEVFLYILYFWKN